MAAELYKDVSLVSIAAQQPTEIHGEQVFGTDPFADENIPEFAVGEIPDSLLDEPDPSISSVSLRRISPFHRRSLEVMFNGDSRVVWTDENGTIFTSFNTKGNSLQDAQLIFTGFNFPAKFAVYGLQDTESLLRVIKASKMLRAAGISTEAICRVVVPDKLPFDGEWLPQDDFKKRLLAEVVERDNKKKMEGVNFETPGRADAAEAAKYLQETMFVVTVRATQVPERIRDLEYVKNEDELTQILGRAMEFANFSNRLHEHTDALVFDVNNPLHREVFFTNGIAEKLGETLAKLHNMGLIHGFTHSGNISMVGTLYDLDSMRGEPLGDKRVTKREIGDDIIGTINGIAAILVSLHKDNYFGQPEPGESVDEDHDSEVWMTLNEFSYNFYLAYLKNTTNSDFDVLVGGSLLDDALDMESLRGQHELLDLVTTRLETQLAKSIVVSEKADGAAKDFFSQATTDIRNSIDSVRMQGNKVSAKDIDELIHVVVYSTPLLSETLAGYFKLVVDVGLSEWFDSQRKIKSKDKIGYARRWFTLGYVSKIMQDLEERGVLPREIEALKAGLAFEPDEVSEEEETKDREDSKVLIAFRDVIDTRNGKEKMGILESLEPFIDGKSQSISVAAS